MFDYIIIGAGLAGLYAGRLLKNLGGGKRFIIIEKRNWIGGRAKMLKIIDRYYPGGAGVCRIKKDKYLLKLMNRYQKHIKKGHKQNVNYSLLNKRIDIMDRINKMKELITPEIRKTMTFKEVYIQMFGEDDYRAFCESCGFTDYENADVYDTVFNYGFDDNTDYLLKTPVNWRAITRGLVRDVGQKRIHLSESVSRVSRNVSDRVFEVDTDKNNYRTKRVIFATDISGLATYDNRIFRRKILPNICGQEFARVYATITHPTSVKGRCGKYFDKKYFTYLGNSLQKTLMMDKKRGIMMLSYSDNKNAKYMKSIFMKPSKYRNIVLEGLCPCRIRIKHARIAYWSIGTHYYRPLNTDIWRSRQEFIRYAQNPERGVFVVGELISQNQGWAEGVFESVERVKKHF